MRRMHLAEIEDQPWCPRTLRDAATDYLRFAYKVANPYADIIPKIADALDRAGTTSVVDLCSGGGGPWGRILPALRDRVSGLRVTMTDLYPNEAAAIALAAELGVEYEMRSVDATSPPTDIKGFRTMFTGFHHFRPEAARRILKSAADAGQGIAIFEFTERRPLALLLMLPAPLLVWLTVPFIRPFRWSRIFWTYPIPVLPFVALWDGFVSCLRTYTTDEMNEMTATIDTHDWMIETVPAPKGPGHITCLIGSPRLSAEL